MPAVTTWRPRLWLWLVEVLDLAVHSALIYPRTYGKQLVWGLKQCTPSFLWVCTAFPVTFGFFGVLVIGSVVGMATARSARIIPDDAWIGTSGAVD